MKTTSITCNNKKCAAELVGGAIFCHICGKRQVAERYKSPQKKSARAEMYWDESRKRWRKRVNIGDSTHVIFGKTKDEVREQIRELERNSKAGVALDDQTTLAEFALEWYATKTAGMKPKTEAVYSNALNVHILPFFSGIKLCEVKPLHVQKLLALRPELSNSAQSKILYTLSQIMRTAVRNGLIAKSPCEDITAGGYGARKKIPLTREQQSKLAEAVLGKRCELFVLLCLYAGLRREEALGLMWENVHLGIPAPYIDVRHTVVFNKGRPFHSTDLKSGAAYRSIPIPEILSNALKCKKTDAGSDLVVHPERSEGAMSESAFRRMWEIVSGPKSRVKVKCSEEEDPKGYKRKTVKRPGLVDFYVAPHLLRHTYITELCASGMDIKKIQYLAGHEDVTMTLRIYAHVTQNTPQELSEWIVKTFPGTFSGTGAAES